MAQPLTVGLAIFGFVLTMLEGRSSYRLMAGALVAWSSFMLVMSGSRRPKRPIG